MVGPQESIIYYLPIIKEEVSAVLIQVSHGLNDGMIIVCLDVCEQVFVWGLVVLMPQQR